MMAEVEAGGGEFSSLKDLAGLDGQTDASTGLEGIAPSSSSGGEFSSLRDLAGLEKSGVKVEAAEIPASGDFDLGDSFEISWKNQLNNLGYAFGAEEPMFNAPDSSIQRLGQIDSVGKAAQFVGQSTVESSTSLATSLASGATGAKIGSLFGPIGAGVGGVVGAGVPTFLELFGENRRELQQEGVDDTALKAVTPAVLSTGVEAFPLFKAAKLVGLGKTLERSVKKAAEDVAEKGLKDRVLEKGREIGELTLAEAATESLQDLSTQANVNFWTDEEVLSLSDYDFERLAFAAAGGAAGGLGTGGALAGGKKAYDLLAETEVGQKVKEKREAGKKQLINSLGGRASRKEALAEQLRQDIDAKKIKIDEAMEILKTAGGRFDPFGKFEPFGKEPRGSYGREKPGPIPTEMGSHPVVETEAVEYLKRPGTREYEYLMGLYGKAQRLAPDGTVSPLAKTESKQDVEVLVGPNDTTSTKEVMNYIREVAESVRSSIGMTTPLIIGNDQTHMTASVQGAYGDLKEVEGLGDILGINLTESGYNEDVPLAEQAPETIEFITEILTHEIGHSAIKESWKSTPAEVQAGLMQGYRDWLTESAKGTWKGMQTAKNPLLFGSKVLDLGPTRRALLARGPEARGYETSFEEYLADNLSKSLQGKRSRIKGTPAMKEWFGKVADVLRKIWNSLSPELRKNTTIDAWVESMLLGQEVKSLESELARVEGMEKATQEDVDAVAEIIAENRTEELSPEDEAERRFYNPQTLQSSLSQVVGEIGLKEQEKALEETASVQLGWFIKSGIRRALLTPIQLAEQAKKAGMTQPEDYMREVQAFQNTKMTQIAKANELLEEWKELGNERTTKLGNFIFEVSTRSDAQKRRLTDEELQTLVEQFGLDDATFDVWKKVDKSFQDILRDIQSGLVLDAIRGFTQTGEEAKALRDQYMAYYFDPDGNAREPSIEESIEVIGLLESITGTAYEYGDDGQPTHALGNELQSIRESVGKMSQRNYFPRSRLGEYTIKVVATAKGAEWDGQTAKREGETIAYYAYDTAKTRDAAFKDMNKDNEANFGVSITADRISTEVQSMMGMPAVLIGQIEASETLNLTQKQRQEIKDISLNLSPGKKFLRNLKKRRGVKGFSTDAFRAYANYVQSASNHLARVEHGKTLTDLLQNFKTVKRKLEKSGSGSNLEPFTELHDYFDRHFKYLMKPDNDWVKARSVGFLWYLGFNVKSAVLNLTQTPMVTYPVLAGKFGDAGATREIGKALKDVASSVRENQGLSDDEKDMFDELLKQGILDESMAMELAGMGEADVLQRMVPGWSLDNVLNRVSYYGGFLFRKGEQYNRRVAALAAYRLAVKQNGSRKRGDSKSYLDPIEEAKIAVEKSQFEYARFNRPEFMRGKKSVLFLFWQYMQHANYLFFGGAGKGVATRMWLMTLLIAGIEGLPWVTTLLELIDWSGTKVKQAFGADNPRVATRDFLAEMALEITDRPDMITHGLSRYYGLGPLHLLQPLGVPVPNVDVGGSLGMGSPVGFLDDAFGDASDPDAAMGKLTASILGPVGSMPIQAWRSAVSTDPDTWKRVERVLPTFMKNGLQGTRWLMRDGESFRGGGEFLSMDKPDERVGAVMKGLGFQPTPLTQKYQQVSAQQDAAVYWTLRKSVLLQDYAYAIAIQDREAKKDAMQAIKEHNAGVRKTKGLRGLGISGKDLRTSVRARINSVRRREMGIPQTKSHAAMFKELEKKYPIDG